MSESKALISIIIPLYNSENYISDTIKSCLNQHYTNLEIIIVDDGSTDNSLNIVKAFNDQRIQIYKQNNKGACAARNFGLSQAQGNLIQFLDADDVLEENKLKQQIEHYLKYGDDYIYSSKMGSIVKDVYAEESGYDCFYRDLSPKDYFNEQLNQFGKYFTTGTWLIPQKLILSTTGWDEHLLRNQDGEYLVRLVLNSKGIKYCPQSLFYYRRDVQGSVGKKVSFEIFESLLKSYERYVYHFAKYLDSETARIFSWKALSIYYCISYPLYPQLLNRCLHQITNLGFREPYPYGGKKFKFIASLIGTKLALKIYRLKSI